MNQKQRIVLLIMAALIILFFLFPPYVMRGKLSGHQIESGFGFIFALPSRVYAYSTVNVPLLLAQIFGVLVVGGIIWFVLKEQIVLVGGPPVSTLRRCPKCAEQIKVDAVVCRFCGYEFQSPPTPKVKGNESERKIPTENFSLQLQELKVKEKELEKNIPFEVDQIRRLELKEELKKIKDSIAQIERG
jgi:hypothetical protein